MRILTTVLVSVLGFVLGAMTIHLRTADAQGSGSVRVQQVSPGNPQMVIGAVVGFSCANDGSGVNCYVASK